MADFAQVFRDFSTEKLIQFGGRIEDCLGRLTDEQVWVRLVDEQNAVGNLVLHLCGNVRQWIGYGVAGLPDVRERDAEFAARGQVSGAELRERLRASVADAVAQVGEAGDEELLAQTTVQKYTLTKMEAIYHVVEHFAQHTAQIVLLTKVLTKQDLGYYRHLNEPGHGERTP